MSQSVETVIGSHLRANDAVQDTIEWTEIVSRFEDGPPLMIVPRRSNRRGVWVAAAAVVITILLIGVIPFLFSSDDPPVADTLVTTTVPALPVEALGAELAEFIVVDVTVVPSVVGDIRITTVQTDARFAPNGLVTTPFGFGSVSRDGSHLLVSEDAIEWFAAPSPFTFPLDPGGDVTGDEDIGYTFSTGDNDGTTLLQWHSADYIQWDPVEPSTADPISDSPSAIRYEVDELPPIECFEQDEHSCGQWFSLDSGWVFGYLPAIQGGVTVPEWASADGVNWEQIAYDGGWNTIGITSGGFFGGSAGNVAINGVMPSSDNPSDTPAASWYWVTQLP